jgi:CheY-like chemotaxis protein
MPEKSTVLKILMVDDRPESMHKQMNYFRDLGHDVTLVPSGEMALIECDKAEYDVAYIDYSMPGMDGIEAGRRLREKNSSVVMFILSVHSEDEYIEKALEAGFDDYLLKDASNQNLRISLIKALRLCDLRRRVTHERVLAHSSYGLLSYVRHLVGVGDLLMELAEVLEPFFQWIKGEYESIPEPLRGEFVSAILLEGEPGSGKTTICKSIANAFQSQSMLPKHLGPFEAQGKWQEPLKKTIKTIYEGALQRKVVVVQADDLVWPSAAQIMDGGLAADWTAYLNTLRECVEDAALINRGETPRGSIVKSIRGTFKGKIMWLLARNRDEEVGAMFEPLRQKLMVFQATFPRNRDDRRDILRFHAEREGVRFEDNALEVALSATSDYSGRDLIGDETGRRGFLWFAIRKVKNREFARYRDGATDLRMTITYDVVQEWLQSEECREINRRVNAAAGNVCGGTTDPHPDGYVAALFPDEQLRGNARKFLEQWERICRTRLAAKASITQRDITSEIPGRQGKKHIERTAISGACKQYGRVMLAFLDAYPEAFSALLTKTKILEWCQRDKTNTPAEG